MNPDRSTWFKPGNKFGQGRPRKSKSQIETIRRRILRVVHRRIFKEKDLESVSTTDLLKFLAQIMPKDFGLSVHPPQVNYISNIPREALSHEEPQLTVQTTEPIIEAATQPEGEEDGNGHVQQL